jgi:uncharacterized protein (TIGR02147 family)
MDINETSPQAWLQAEFRLRRKKNPNYSLRRMAQQLGLASGRLSELMNGRRRVTRATALKIAGKLAYPPEKKRLFLETLADHASARGEREESDEVTYQQLSTDAFHVLADWYHFAILSLMELDDFDPAPLAIAARLGITPTEARSSLDRLLRLGLIEKKKDGRLTKTAKNLTTTNDIESAALQESHRQNLALAAASLDEDELSLRDITSITMAIDVAKLPLAKTLIKKFRRQLSAQLEAGAKNEVYNLNIQLIPLTKRRGRK